MNNISHLESNRPLVSIITPSYNQGEFIEDTIISVKNQKYPYIEHIIIDGGSTDSTLKIIKNYKHEYNLKWISEPDKGPADACNKGFRLAKGSILGYINSDDMFLPESTEKAVEVFINNKKVDAIFGNGIVIDKDNKPVRKIFSPCFFHPILYVLGGFSIIQPGSFWRKSIYEKIGGFNENNLTCWDGEFWIDLVSKGARYKYIDEYLALFRIQPSSITVKKDTSWELNLAYKRDKRKLFKRVLKRSPNFLDRNLFSLLSKVFSRLITPRKLFPKFGLDGKNLESILKLTK